MERKIPEVTRGPILGDSSASGFYAELHLRGAIKSRQSGVKPGTVVPPQNYMGERIAGGGSWPEYVNTDEALNWGKRIEQRGVADDTSFYPEACHENTSVLVTEKLALDQLEGKISCCINDTPRICSRFFIDADITPDQWDAIRCVYELENALETHDKMVEETVYRLCMVVQNVIHEYFPNERHTKSAISRDSEQCWFGGDGPWAVYPVYRHDQPPDQKQSVHIVCPNIHVYIANNTYVMTTIRDVIVRQLDRHFTLSGHSWAQILDMSVYNRNSTTLRRMYCGKNVKCTDCALHARLRAWYRDEYTTYMPPLGEERDEDIVRGSLERYVSESTANVRKRFQTLINAIDSDGDSVLLGMRRNGFDIDDARCRVCTHCTISKKKIDILDVDAVLKPPKTWHFIAGHSARSMWYNTVRYQRAYSLQATASATAAASKVAEEAANELNSCAHQEREQVDTDFEGGHTQVQAEVRADTGTGDGVLARTNSPKRSIDMLYEDVRKDDEETYNRVWPLALKRARRELSDWKALVVKGFQIDFWSKTAVDEWPDKHRFYQYIIERGSLFPSCHYKKMYHSEMVLPKTHVACQMITYGTGSKDHARPGALRRHRHLDDGTDRNNGKRKRCLNDRYIALFQKEIRRFKPDYWEGGPGPYETVEVDTVWTDNFETLSSIVINVRRDSVGACRCPFRKHEHKSNVIYAVIKTYVSKNSTIQIGCFSSTGHENKRKTSPKEVMEIALQSREELLNIDWQ